MLSQPSRRFVAPAALGSVLAVLIGVGPGRSGDPPAVPGGPGEPQVTPPAAGQAQPKGLTNPDYFTNVKKQTDERKKKAAEQFDKTRQVAQQHIDAQAKARGGPDQARRQLGATIAEINARLNYPAGQAPPADAGAAARVEPGMRVEIIMKDGMNEYSGALVGIDGTKILLQTIPIAGVKPEAFDMSNIQAFHTSFGLFAYIPRIGRFVPALTYYRFNKATGNFERAQSGNGDAFLAEDAKIVGPTNSAQVTFGTAADGSWSIGLPIPVTESPQAIPAENFQQIITAIGTYTYDPKTKDYTYKSHAQFAQEAKAQQDAAGQAYYDREWQRATQAYQLGTSRAAAMAPYYNSTDWVWWRR